MEIEQTPRRLSQAQGRLLCLRRAFTARSRGSRRASKGSSISPTIRRFNSSSRSSASSDQGAALTLDTSDGQQVDFLIAGKVRFLVGNGEYELTLLKDTDRGRFFLPFNDATNGLETYKEGRYLDPQQKPNGKLTIDFNYAYNPYCAYGEGWSCPLPPEQNKLPVEILRWGKRRFAQTQVTNAAT